MTMTTTNENIITRLISEEVAEQNKLALDMVNYYTKVSDIVERTHVAMGRKNSYRVEIATTKNQKLNTNAYASTH
jgi:hypothetical protein